jgi:lipopolysaccharide biosynthesis glycosyltransferase
MDNDTMKNVKIFVSCHKESFVPENTYFVPVQVGAALTDKRLAGMTPDNTGDNISHKNKSFCELTAQYWVWKNVDADYYGFCHYRRYFSFNSEKLDCDGWKTVCRHYLNKTAINEMQVNDEQIKKQVLPYDIITPTAVPLREVNFKSVYEQYKAAHKLNIEDVDTVMEIIKERHPEFTKAAEKYIYGSTAYFCNMFIMKKELFYEYCEWLFDILFEFERRWDPSLRSEEGLRTPGHLGERLFGVYVTWLKEQNKYSLNELQMMTFGNTDVFVSPKPAFEKNNIPIVFASNEYFAPYCAVAIQSIIQSGSPNNNYDILIMERQIESKTKALMKKMVEGHPNVSLRFINVGHVMSEYDSLKVFEHVTVETYFRLTIPELLPDYDKILYLDGDLIAKADVADLYNTHIGDNAVAAALDVVAIGHVSGFTKAKEEYYKRRVRLKDIRKQFNAGVMIFNCKRIRSCFSMEELLRFAQLSKFDLADQDCLISLFQDETYWLDLEWNANIYEVETLGYYVASFAPKELFDRYRAAIANPKIMHYAGTVKPWHDPSYILAEEFWQMARNTPFYETILYRRIVENVNHTANILRGEMGWGRKKPKPPLPPNRSFKRKVADFIFPPFTRRREFAKNVYYKITGRPRPQA